MKEPPGQGLASDAADGLWCQQHLRHLSVALTGLFLILGLAFTALDVVALCFQIAAMAFGMPFIFREVAQSLKKRTVDLSSLASLQYSFASLFYYLSITNHYL